jgi:hypothetical protein
MSPNVVPVQAFPQHHGLAWPKPLHLHPILKETRTKSSHACTYHKSTTNELLKTHTCLEPKPLPRVPSSPSPWAWPWSRPRSGQRQRGGEGRRRGGAARRRGRRRSGSTGGEAGPAPAPAPAPPWRSGWYGLGSLRSLAGWGLCEFSGYQACRLPMDRQGLGYFSFWAVPRKGGPNAHIRGRRTKPISSSISLTSHMKYKLWTLKSFILHQTILKNNFNLSTWCPH